MDPLTSGFLASLAADALLGGVSSLRGPNLEKHVREAGEDTAQQFDRVQPEHFTVLFQTDNVQEEIQRFKNGGPPPERSTLTSELARITNLGETVDLDAVTETYLENLQRRMSADEEAWRRIQTHYIQEQFDEMQAIRESISGLSENIDELVEAETAKRGPTLELRRFEPMSTALMENMFDTLGRDDLDRAGEQGKKELKTLMNFFESTAAVHMTIRNASSVPAYSSGVRMRLISSGGEYEDVYPIYLDDMIGGLPGFNNRPQDSTTIKSDSNSEYMCYIKLDTEAFPETWKEVLEPGFNGEVTPTEALRALYRGGIDSLEVELDLLYEDDLGDSDTLNIVSRECQLDKDIDFRQLLLSGPGERDYLNGALDMLDDMDVKWP